MCPEILNENGQTKIIFKPGEELASGFLEGAPPITIVEYLEIPNFEVIERAGERILVVKLPTKVDARTEIACWLIPPHRWSEFPNPINNQSV